jgi:septal ring factor EnvC (AmiA/AmiB activator)
LRLFFIFAFTICLFGASQLPQTAQGIEKDIKKTKDVISQKGSEVKKLSSSIDDWANDIINEQKNLKSLDGQIASLEVDVTRLSGEFQQKMKQIEEYEAQKNRLVNEKTEIEKKLVEIMSKDLAASVVITENTPNDQDDIIKSQLSRNLSKVVGDHVKKLKAEYVQRGQMIKELEVKVRAIKMSVLALEQKKNQLARTKDDKIKLIAKIQKQVEAYKQRLQAIAKEQQQARETLERLNILKRQKLVEAQKKPTPTASGQTKPLAKGDVPDIKISEADLNGDIRMLGSSYQPAKAVHYGGKKVPAPIDDFRIVKHFGPYIDPIYKIRIHNDSVQMRANGQDVIVKNILDGKVVFAKEVASLGNVVIVQHEGNLHSIYAHLTKIAPTIAAGKKIPQGFAVGRINKELTFEVTKEDVPINPLEVVEGN